MSEKWKEDLVDPRPLRQEMYLAKLHGVYDGELPAPVTKEDKYLYELAVNGASGGGIAAGIEYLERGDFQSPTKIKIYGNPVAPRVMQEEDTLKEVTLAEGVEYIGENAFEDCMGLETVVFPSTLTEIGDQAFRNCISLENAVLPDGLEVLGADVFENCNRLAMTSLPSSLREIGSKAFSSCYLVWIKAVPGSVKRIESHAFKDCHGLTEITFEGTPDSISDNAFYGCVGLQTINVPWSKGAVEGAPWGADGATVNHDYVK